MKRQKAKQIYAHRISPGIRVQIVCTVGMQTGCVKFVYAEKGQISESKDCAFAYLPECLPNDYKCKELQAPPPKTDVYVYENSNVHRTLSTQTVAVARETKCPNRRRYTYLNWIQVLIAFSCRWAFQRIRRKWPSFVHFFLSYFTIEIHNTHRRRFVGHSVVLRAHIQQFLLLFLVFLLLFFYLW